MYEISEAGWPAMNHFDSRDPPKLSFSLTNTLPDKWELAKLTNPLWVPDLSLSIDFPVRIPLMVRMV
jgi:hypothetical protein